MIHDPVIESFRVDQGGDDGGIGTKSRNSPSCFVGEFRKVTTPVTFSTRMAETGDEFVLNRVPTDEEDWNRCGRRLGRESWRWTATRDYDRNTAADKVFRQTGQAIVLAPSPTKFDRYVFAFDIAGFIQSLAERGQIGHVARRTTWR